MVRLAIIGIGEQTRLTHLPCIDLARELQHEVSVVAVADFPNVLEARRSVLDHHCPAAVCVDVPWTAAGGMTTVTADETVTALARHGIDAAIVATEPLSHFEYLKALERAGIPYLVDKPFICRPGISVDPGETDAAIAELDWLQRTVREQRGFRPPLGSVNITRRFDLNLGYARQLLQNAATLTGQHVSHVSVVYCDGERRDAEGCHDQEQHPFKYGYGGLNHSGYHAIDTAVWIAGYDRPISETTAIDVQVLSRSAADYLSDTYPASATSHPVTGPAMSTEYDSVVNVRLSRPGTVTLLSLAIVHDSTTNRRWGTAQNLDQALHLGRLSHESVIVTQGELQTIALRMVEIPHSADSPSAVELPSRVNSGDITRNPLFAQRIDGPIFEPFGGQPLNRRSLTESAKWRAFRNFIAKLEGAEYDTAIDIDRHIVSQTILLLAARSHACRGATIKATVDSHDMVS